MNLNENDLWRDETELLNFRLSKLPSAKGLLKLEFDTKDQVLSVLPNFIAKYIDIKILGKIMIPLPSYIPPSELSFSMFSGGMFCGSRINCSKG